jgi:hypothetical protein
MTTTTVTASWKNVLTVLTSVRATIQDLVLILPEFASQRMRRMSSYGAFSRRRSEPSSNKPCATPRLIWLENYWQSLSSLRVHCHGGGSRG